MDEKYRISPKLGKSCFIDYDGLMQSHFSEIGFQLLNKDVPDLISDESIPPIEFYDNIAENYDNGNFEQLKETLDNFTTYLYKNGLDDIEEFNQSRMEQILVTLCESKNADISQRAFHIITLLQSKGPAFPEFCFDLDFFNLCNSYLVKNFSVILYYCLAAIFNICCKNDQSRNYIIEQIPLQRIKSLCGHFDINVREAALDLACVFLKSPLPFEYCIEVLNIVKELLEAKDDPNGENGTFEKDDEIDQDNELDDKQKKFLYSGFWILVRILRHYPELTEKVMTPKILRRANEVFDDDNPDTVIPGLIFISYVYELKYEIPHLDYNGILHALASPPTPNVQRLAYETLNRIFTCRPDLICKFIQHGLIIETSTGLDNAKFVDKIAISMIVCNAILKDIGSACDRVIETKSISFFLDLFEIDDEELNKLALECLIRIFDEADMQNQASLLKGRFIKNDGIAILEKLEHEEDNDLSLQAASFKNRYFAEDIMEE